MPVSYPYEDLDDRQFERLVVQCMRKLFGSGTQSFCAGPDGGRDARFVGIADSFPSRAKPWAGTTIGQAKHTSAINAHFSDSDFSGAVPSSVLSQEVPRIKKLVDSEQLDGYVIFSNRRLGGVTAPAIEERISGETGLGKDKVFLVGLEYLDDMLHLYPDLPVLARLDPIDGPLLPSSYDLAEVILAIADELGAPLPARDASVVDRVSYDDKNRINTMSTAFAKELSRRYMGDTLQIEKFLADPGNLEVLRRYEGAVEEFQLKIIAHRAQHQSFDRLFNYLFDLLVDRDGILSRNRKLTRVMLFYMYWHCDIGESPDVVA